MSTSKAGHGEAVAGAAACQERVEADGDAGKGGDAFYVLINQPIKVEMQTRRLKEVETRLALLETIPGFFFFQWLGLLLLRLMVVLRKASRVNYLLLMLYKLNRLVFSPFSAIFKYPKKISAGINIDEEEKKNSNAMEPIEQEALSLANKCSPGVMIRRLNPRNRSLGL